MSEHFEHEEARLFTAMSESAAKYGGERDIREAAVHLATAANGEEVIAILNAVFVSGVAAGIKSCNELMRDRR